MMRSGVRVVFCSTFLDPLLHRGLGFELCCRWNLSLTGSSAARTISQMCIQFNVAGDSGMASGTSFKAIVPGYTFDGCPVGNACGTFTETNTDFHGVIEIVDAANVSPSISCVVAYTADDELMLEYTLTFWRNHSKI